jgi:hypothetical protein
MREVGFFELSGTQRERWKGLELQRTWAKKFPELFDEEDLRLAISQGRLGYGLIEWLGAIFFHHLTGYHALVGKYQFGNHKRKRAVLKELGGDALLDVLRARQPGFGNAQGPDLLMFSPDRSAFFFGEIKGSKEPFTPSQERFFQFLEQTGHRDTYFAVQTA